MRHIILATCVLLTACNEQPQQVRTEIKPDGTKVEYVDRPGGSGGGMMEHMAGAAVAGAAAGAAGAAAHRVTDHAINRFQERREQRREAQAHRPMVRRGPSGFGRGRR